MIQLNFLKQITILGSMYTVEWDKTHNGGSFSTGQSKIIVGMKSYKVDPMYTMNMLSHEILEVILVMMGARYDDNRIGENYLFSFSHQTFENAVEIHTQAMTQFIKWKK